jgi:hypothetical protein
MNTSRDSMNLRGGWFGLGGPLQIAIFCICSWQAYWALANMVTLAKGSTTNTIVTGGIAVALILGRNVLAVRLPTMSWVQWLVGGVCLALCMAFSVVTSQLHLAQQVQGGHVASIKSSEQYQRADAAYRAAAGNLSAVEAEIAAAAALGDTASAGYIRRSQLPRAEDRLEQARSNLARVSQSGQAGVAATIVTETAQHLRLTPEQFAVALASLAAVLLELVGVLLAWYDGNTLRRSEATQRPPQQAAPLDPEPQQ